MRTHTLSTCLSWAKEMTTRAASVKSWRLTRKSDRLMQDVAKTLANGRGYIIASSRELEAMYPDLYKADLHASEVDKKFVWCVNATIIGGTHLSFCPVC